TTTRGSTSSAWRRSPSSSDERPARARAADRGDGKGRRTGDRSARLATPAPSRHRRALTDGPGPGDAYNGRDERGAAAADRHGSCPARLEPHASLLRGV